MNVLDGVVLLAVIVLVGFGIWNSTRDKEPEQTCAQPGITHEVQLKDDSFNKTNLTLRMCDILKIVNLDTNTFSLAFGVHDKHVSYPGYSQTELRPNEYITVSALEAGAFRMHDHLRDNAYIDLTIQPSK
jgi:hypothetical protein